MVTLVSLVGTSPGAMPLTRMPSRAQASPSVLVRLAAPAFDCGSRHGVPMVDLKAATLETMMIFALGFSQRSVEGAGRVHHRIEV